MNLTLIWLGAVVLFAVVEGMTSALVGIWFAIGAVAAFVSSFMLEGFLAQATVFVVVSLLSLLITRPLVKQRLQPKHTPTNSDRLIGMQCKVVEDIFPGEKGRVQVDGTTWLAESEVGLYAGDFCQVEHIQGVTLKVIPQQHEEVQVSCHSY